MIPLANVPSEPVLIADGAVVPLAQRSVVSEDVHAAPLLQHPPPIEEAQLNWPVVHPLGTIDTSVVGAAIVEAHWLFVHE